MSLTIFYGLLTLAPLALGVALAALGLARRAARVVGMALAALGVVLPVAGLAWLAAEVGAGYPVEIPFWGGATAWVAIYARADALSVWAGLGIAGLVTPLLLWVAWRAAPPDAASAEPVAPAIESQSVDAEPGESGESAEAETETVAGAEEPVAESRWATTPMRRWQWAGVALTLGLESFALSLVFAENIVWLVIAWLLVIGAAWALGELGSDPQTLDWKGLALMVIGPVVWLVAALLVAKPAGDPRLIDLMGAALFPMGHVLAMTLAVAVAAGAWPALGWLRKRASITAPVGLGAVALVVTPLALFVGARTFSIAQTVSGEWPAFTVGKPPITIGVVVGLLGAATALFAGLLALVRRDGRGLLASGVLAEAGWGLLGLGIGEPLAGLGVTLLLATSTLGLGAMLASLVASGAVTADIEPDSAGPRVFGEPLRPAALTAWVVGAGSVVGLPLFAGFAPLQIISAAALPAPRIMIPMVGLAWGGAALLLIGLTRATAPAFATPVYAGESVPAISDSPADGQGAVDAENGDDALEAPPVDAPELRADDLPGVALAALAVIVGVAPAALLAIGAIPAAAAFAQAGALDGATLAEPAGYVAGVGQWLATPAAVMFALVALALAIIRWRLPRAARPAPIYLGGQAAGETLDGEHEALELDGMSEPGDAWEDLRPALRAGWLTPGAGWLGVGADEVEGPGNDAATEVPDAESGGAGAATPADESSEVDGAAESAAEPLPEASALEPVADSEPGAPRGER